MSAKITALIKNNKGAAFILMAVLTIFIFVFFMAGIEVLKVFSVTYNVNTQLVRLVNNAVETNIDDAYRADGYNQLTSLSDAYASVESNFHFYTQSSTQSNGWNTPAAGFVGGSCYGGSNGDFLYTINIDSITGDDAQNQPFGQQAPSLTCSGTIYIANSIPGMLETFVFQIPFTVQSTNFRINELQSTAIGGSAGG